MMLLLLRRLVMGGSVSRTAAWSLFLLLYYTVAVQEGEGSNRCDVPLGLQDSSIPDSAIVTNITGTTPSAARLNGPSAWCFKLSDLRTDSQVKITFDIGRLALISGLLSQGPPSTLYNNTYSNTMLFSLYNSSSVNGDDWEPCCDGESIMFQAKDKRGETDVISKHPLNTLIVARRITLQFLTNLRWPGYDNRCFRFEILGCPENAEPVTDIQLEALPGGWIVAKWDVPSIGIPSSDSELDELPLSIEKYLVTMDRTGGGEANEVIVSEVTARRMVVSGPLWGATYSVEVICEHQGINLMCGSAQIEATIAGCELEQDSCRLQDQLVLRQPSTLKGAVLDEGEVRLTWTSESSGWVTPSIGLKIEGNDGRIVHEKELNYKDESVIVTGVTGGNNYSVTFSPQATGNTLDTVFSFNLYIIAWQDVVNSGLSSGYGAFVTDVDLAAHILWDGKLRVRWSPAEVLGATWEAVPVPSTTDTTTSTTTSTTTTTPISTTSTTTVGSSTSVTTSSTDTEGVNAANRRIRMTPTPVISTKATAYNYTVTLLSDSGKEEINFVPTVEDTMFQDFLLLRLKEHYRVSLMCHFGGVSVACGELKVYTELPLHWTTISERLVIHAPSLMVNGWAEQEAECRLGGGALVSLTSTTEDDQLKKAITQNSEKPILDTFWLGLNLCSDYKGDLWSDGTLWQHSRLPQVNPKLSSDTCCVRAVWKESDDHYVWLGEACDAILPAVCEYKPQGLVGTVEDVTRDGSNVTATRVNWTYVPEYWTPSSMVLENCYVRDLTYIAFTNNNPSMNCSTSTVLSNVTSYTQTGLEPFTEYFTKVSAGLTSIDYVGPSTGAYLRTQPEEPVIVKVLPSGHIQVMWAKKVADYEEEELVKLKVYNSTHPTVPMHDRNIKAVGVNLEGVTLGETYIVNLEEPDNQRRKETLSLQAYPECDCKECQLGGWCYAITEERLDAFTANKECKDNERRLPIVATQEEVDHLLELATAMEDDLWISHNSEKIKGTEATLKETAALLAEEDAEIIDDEIAEAEAKAEEDAEKNIKCLIISREFGAVIEEPCEKVHKTVCRYKAPVSTIFPPTSEITTEIGGSWIILKWNTSISGWRVKYTVYYQRTQEKRFKRALKWQTFQSAPVEISNLQRDTTYTLELEADLGQGFLSSSGEFEIATTNSTSKPSHSEELRLGSVAVGSYEIVQLICYALLIAACITTMMLFFATGMFYQDCVAQLGFLSTLLAAYFNLMLAHPSTVRPENETGCIVLAVILHYLFLCSFMFLMLEALTIAHLLVTPIRSPFQKSNWLMMAFGLSVPLVIVGISAGIIYYDYPDFFENNCWVNPEGSAIYGEVIPMIILVIATIVLLFSTLFTKDTPPELIEINLRGRQSDSHKLRWVLLALVIELSVAWGTGVAAYQTHLDGFHIVFCMFTIFLAITIVGARTTFDDTFRSKMHRLCCGTELTYKRSELLTLSGKSRISPQPLHASASSRLITPVGSKPFAVTNSAASVGGRSFTTTKSASSVGSRRIFITDSASSKGRRRPSIGMKSPSSIGSRQISVASAASSEEKRVPSVGVTTFTVRATPTLSHTTELKNTPEHSSSKSPTSVHQNSDNASVVDQVPINTNSTDS